MTRKKKKYRDNRFEHSVWCAATWQSQHVTHAPISFMNIPRSDGKCCIYDFQVNKHGGRRRSTQLQLVCDLGSRHSLWFGDNIKRKGIRQRSGNSVSTDYLFRHGCFDFEFSTMIPRCLVTSFFDWLHVTVDRLRAHHSHWAVAPKQSNMLNMPDLRSKRPKRLSVRSI